LVTSALASPIAFSSRPVRSLRLQRSTFRFCFCRSSGRSAFRDDDCLLSFGLGLLELSPVFRSFWRRLFPAAQSQLSARALYCHFGLTTAFCASASDRGPAFDVIAFCLPTSASYRESEDRDFVGLGDLCLILCPFVAPSRSALVVSMVCLRVSSAARIAAFALICAIFGAPNAWITPLGQILPGC